MKNSIFYEDLSWFGKLLVRLHIKRRVLYKKSLEDLIRSTINLEKMERSDINFNLYIQEYFK